MADVEKAMTACNGAAVLANGGHQENELQTKLRIVRRNMKDRDNCIVLKVDKQLTTSNAEINPFGFHFELDKKKYDENKKSQRKAKIFKWLSWVAYYHHKFGIRHLLLVFMLVAYVFIGGAMFLAVEAPYELEDLKETIILMNGIIAEETLDVINITLTYNGTIREEKLARLLKRYYKTMLEAEGRFHGSVWHKSENLEMNLMWYFSSSTFYCMTLFSTIGYGTIACQTTTGRVLSVVYACIGIPLMLVVLGDIGDWFQKILTKTYVFFLYKWKHWRNQPLPEDPSEILLPMWIALPLVSIYLVSCSTFILLFDHSEGKLPGIGFGDAFYFTFISLTTIGLGDVMPYNIQYSPILASAFLLGLALISIVNTSIYAQLYDKFFNGVEAMEYQLDRIHKATHKPSGTKVFQDLEPAIIMLVCSTPHIGNQTREFALEGILKAGGDGGKKDKKVTYSNVVRKRTISYSGDDGAKTSGAGGRTRAPTIGVMGGRDLAKFRKQRQSQRRLSDERPSEALSGRRSSDVGIGTSAGLPDWLKSMKKEVNKKQKEAIEVAATSDLKRAERTLPVEGNFDDLYGDAPTPKPVESIQVEVVDELIDLKTDQEPNVSSEIEFEKPDDEESKPRSRRRTISDDGSRQSSSVDDDEPPADRPPPLIVLPDDADDSNEDEDEDEEDDDWQPPSGKFANLKRGSVFVPRGQGSDDDYEDGPSVEYIP